VERQELRNGHSQCGKSTGSSASRCDAQIRVRSIGSRLRDCCTHRSRSELNECGTDDGALFREGLPQFFTDLPLSFQSKVVYVTPALEQQMLSALDVHSGKSLLETRYSIIAKPYSKTRQNSTAWILETLAAAQNPLADSRKEAQMVLESQAYSPDTLKIAYHKRIAGGLFKANAVFTDHPLSARLSGSYQVTTVRSIFSHLQKTGLLERSIVLVPDGQLKLAGD
jgi:hypothetical protein